MTHGWELYLTQNLSIFDEVHKLKGNDTGYLLFAQDMVLPIKHTAIWKLTHQPKQEQISYDNSCGNENILDHYYQVRDRVMFGKK